MTFLVLIWRIVLWKWLLKQMQLIMSLLRIPINGLHW